MSKKSAEREAIVQKYGSVEDYPLFARIRPELRTDVAGRVCYHPEHRFCYFRIPKAANSSVVLTLAHHAGLIRGRRFKGDPAMWSDAAKSKLRRIPPLEDLDRLVTFTFVRNPYSRILSTYLDKFFAEKRDRYAETLGVSPPRHPIGFREFLDRLEGGKLHANPHWAPQVDLIPLPLDQLVDLGRVETLTEDLNRIVQRVFHQSLDLKNKERGRTAAADRVGEFIGVEERALIDRLYARDFEAFYPDARNAPLDRLLTS